MGRIRLNNLAGVAGHALTGEASITIKDGRVTAFGGADSSVNETLDCTGLTAWPGVIAVHIHGAVGIDVNTADADGLLDIGRFLARHGVTAWMPTLVPDSEENYGRTIAEIDRFFEIQTGTPVAQAVGVHYEGVFAN